jgi:hypothetical protein
MDLDECMLIHVKLFQFKLGKVRLEKVGKTVDHIRPDCSSLNLDFIGLRKYKSNDNDMSKKRLMYKAYTYIYA